jgi:hypothetical protein
MTALSLNMDSNELFDWISENGPVHVIFNDKAESMECYPEEGIQCLITAVIATDSEVHKWKVNYTPFEVVNALHESSNYYGPAPRVNEKEKRPAYLSAYATRFYKREDFLYVETNDKIGRTLLSIQPANALEVKSDVVEQRFLDLQKDLDGFSI